MKNTSSQTLLTLAAFISALTLLAPTARAASWTGANGNWSSTTSPGWNGPFPNAVGAVADHPNAATSITTQDVTAGVTVGTISLTNNSNNSWTISLSGTNLLTLDQDGAGSGSATISNTNTNAGTTNTLIFSSGTLRLADNLLISNTGSSARTVASGGAIEFANTSVLSGTGNITISNTLNNVAGLTGAIRFNGGTNSFVGNILIQKGFTSFNSNTSFGGVATNVITLGASGQGSATLLASSGVTVANNWTVAAGSGGTLTMGATSTGNVTYSGTGTLNGDLNLQTASTTTNYTRLSGVISGAGSIIKTGTGNGWLSNTANSYTGTTTIDNGVLRVGGLAAVNTNSSIGRGSVGGSASDLVFGGGTLQYTEAAATTTSRLFTIGNASGLTATLDASGSALAGTLSFTGTGALGLGGSGARTLNLIGTNTGNNTLASIIGDGTGGLTSVTKSGAGTWVVSGVNTYTGNTTVSAGTLILADNAGLKFVIGATGVNNQINGAGTISLDGDFTFDLTAAGTTIGNSWTIVDIGTLTETFGATFSVVGFTESSNVWTGSSGGATYRFTEATGILNVVPEPSSWALLAGGLSFVMILRRRKRA